MAVFNPWKRHYQSVWENRIQPHPVATPAKARFGQLDDWPGIVGRGPWTLVGDTKPAPADNPVELRHLTGEDAETAEEPEGCARKRGADEARQTTSRSQD